MFCFLYNFSISTPLTMHMYAWTKSNATLYNGIILGGGGVIAIVVFIGIKILSKRWEHILYFFIIDMIIFDMCYERKYKLAIISPQVDNPYQGHLVQKIHNTASRASYLWYFQCRLFTNIIWRTKMTGR